MKTATLLLLLLCTAMGLAQEPNPEVFQTWHLRWFQATDMSPVFVIGQIEPPIASDLHITGPAEFSGTGACNGFFGSFTTLDSFFWQTGSFGATLLVCEPESHFEFETAYFNFLQSAGTYEIFPEDQGLRLVLSHPLMGQAVYQNYTLGIESFGANHMALFPNPVQDQLYVDSGGVAVFGAVILNAMGQVVQQIEGSFDRIGTAGLPCGMYVVQLKTSGGTMSKKFIKS